MDVGLNCSSVINSALRNIISLSDSLPPEAEISEKTGFARMVTLEKMHKNSSSKNF